MYRLFSLFAILLALGATGGVAQGRFVPELQVGDRVVTNYQVEQRVRFLGLLGASGDVRGIAREQLINEAIQFDAAEENEIEISDEQLEVGMQEFAARGNLNIEQLMDILSRAGVQPETFRDFILAGVAWREVVRQRFSDVARASIPEHVIRRTLAQTGTDGGTRVLVSEILLPTTDPATALASRERAVELSSITSEEAFAAAARRYSVGPTATAGGAQDWAALDALSPKVRSSIVALAPGQASRPVELENAVGVFFLRDLEQVRAGTDNAQLIDYALFQVEGDRAKADAVSDRIDVCDDLYGEAMNLPEDRLIRETRPLNELPADIRAELVSLDHNEASTALTRGGSATVLMLCERLQTEENTVDLNIIGIRLLNVRLSTTAVQYLTELRANTTVIDLTN